MQASGPDPKLVTLTSVSGVAVALAVGPGVAAAQPVDPTAMADAPAFVRGAGSFLLVSLFGGVVLARREPLVDRAVDDVMGRPSVSVLYGLVAFVLVLFAGFYASDLLGRVGVAATPLGYVAIAILVGGVSTLAGLGYVVVGTLLTDLHGGRRPWYGLLLGAALSAVGWVALPVPAAFAVWVLVAAFGVGGRTRTWIHSERFEATELES